MTSTQQSSQADITRLKGPGKYHVIMLNDDATPMDFVVQILMGIFKKTAEQATEVMLEVHEKGRGIAGTYMYEIAEQKVAEVTNTSRINGFPLSATIEEAE